MNSAQTFPVDASQSVFSFCLQPSFSSSLSLSLSLSLFLSSPVGGTFVRLPGCFDDVDVVDDDYDDDCWYSVIGLLL